MASIGFSRDSVELSNISRNVVVDVIDNRQLSAKMSSLYDGYYYIFLANDCSFEDGWCGWHNADIGPAPDRHQWRLYNCNSNKYGEFRGLQSDVTFAGGTGMLPQSIGHASDSRFRSDFSPI